MAWIPMRTDLEDDPAVIAIAEGLNLETDHVVGKLHRLWSWANQQLRDGNASGVTESWVDRYVGMVGFAHMMAQQGWLVVHERGIHFPNFDAWNSQSAKERAVTARRVAVHRLKKCNAPTVTKTVPTEQNNTEEKKEKNKTPLPPKGEVASPRASKATFDPALVELPPNLNDDTFRQTWADWCDYRRKAKKAISEPAAKRQLASLAKAGRDRAIQAIDESIQNDWQGLFPENVNGSHKRTATVKNGPGQTYHGAGMEQDPLA